MHRIQPVPCGSGFGCLPEAVRSKNFKHKQKGWTRFILAALICLSSAGTAAAAGVKFNGVVVQDSQLFHVEERPRYIFGQTLALELFFAHDNVRTGLLFSASAGGSNLRSDMNPNANGSRRALLFIEGLKTGKSMVTVCAHQQVTRKQICRQLPVIRIE